MSSSAKSKEIASMSQKTFIIRSNQGDFLLKNANVILEKEVLVGVLEAVPKDHQVYIKDDKGRYSYDSKTKSVLQEIDIYTPLDPTSTIGSSVSIPISDISKMELIEKDQSKSTTNTLLLAAGVTLGVATIVYVATVSSMNLNLSPTPTTPTNPNEPPGMSCPFVSVYDGTEFVFQGETFGGALFHSVARQDYLPLPSLKPSSEVQLMISNERLEAQFTDMADLILVEHDPGEKILADPNGSLFLVHDLDKAKVAKLNGSKEMLDRIAESDNIYCSFNDLKHDDPLNELIVKFDHPGKGKDLALYLSLRDSPWLEHIFESYMSMYGEESKAFMETMNTKSAEELYQWQEMNLVPLIVSVKTPEGWKEIRQTRFVGPVMNREIAISLEGLDLSGPTVEVSFKTGFLYWEIDRISLASVSRISSDNIHILKPSSAIDEEGKDQLASIYKMDDKFLEQTETGNKVYLTYNFEEFSEGKSYSAVLHTSGYYHSIREIEGPINREFLTKYDKPGGLANFSRDRFKEVYKFQTNASK
ncbi:hypothetical protein [Shivajiella indica]|uniref:Uncharacterized protein n=1 Tax=Shivajiella indica TaxID=872115 RepID=A0ABW5B798_9BACT